jgi:hypothetical protein
MSEQFGAMMGMGDNGEGFEPGGVPTFPFMQNFMPKTEDDGSEYTDAEDEEPKDKKGKKHGKKKGENNQKKRKFLPLYCTNLTQKAKDGKIDRREVDAELFSVVGEGAGLAGVEENFMAAGFDVQAQTVLAGQAFPAGGIFGENGDFHGTPSFSVMEAGR